MTTIEPTVTAETTLERVEGVQARARAEVDAIKSWILSAAADRGLTVGALAREAGINDRTLRRHLAPGGALKLMDLVNVGAVFGLGPAELVEAARRARGVEA